MASQRETDEILRNFSRFLPEDSEQKKKLLNDIAALMVTKKAGRIKNIAAFIIKAIKRSLAQQKEEKKEHPVLNAALVNIHLSDMF